MSIHKKDWLEYVQVDPDAFSRMEYNKIFKDQDKLIMVDKDGSSRKKKLKVVAPITHALRLTNNSGLYQPRMMVNDHSSFLKPSRKPILINHNSGGDPIGRMQTTIYEPLDVAGIPRGIENLSFEDTIRLIQTLMKNKTLYDPEFAGAGHVLAEMLITDNESIEKFLDERYLNFSIRVSTNDVFDPFTGKSMYSDDEEEDNSDNPLFMDREDWMKGFAILDRLFYKETSVATIPADELAIVSSLELSDSINKLDTDPMKIVGSYIINIEDSKKSIKESKNMLNKDQSQEVKTEDEKVDSSESQPDVFDFESINENSTLEEHLKALENCFQDEDKELIMPFEEIVKLDGKDLCGPKNTFPALNIEYTKAGLELLKKGSYSDSAKKRIEKSLLKKLDSFQPSAKEGVWLMDEIKDTIDQVSNFDLSDFVDFALEEANKRGMEVDEISNINLFVEDSLASTSQAKVYSAKIKELEGKVKNFQDANDELTSKCKNFASISSVLLKVFKDNLKIESLTSAIDKVKSEDTENIEKEISDMLTDEKLISQIEKYLGGFSKETSLEDGTCEDPTVKNSHAKNNDEDEDSLVKSIKDRYTSLFKDSEFEAESFINNMLNRNYIDSSQFEAIKALTKEDNE